jgi:8-oxo-dGTP pyrophosphatase MutT (NUDIX family)
MAAPAPLPTFVKIDPAFTCGSACLLVRREAGGPFLGVIPARGAGFPGGKLELGEDPVTCALRECREEAGVDLRYLRREACYLGELQGRPEGSTGGRPVALIWLPPIGPVELGPPTREGRPAWVTTEELCAAGAFLPGWNAWAIEQAAQFERDPEPFGASRSAEPDLVAMLREAVDRQEARGRATGEALPAAAGARIAQATLPE